MPSLADGDPYAATAADFFEVAAGHLEAPLISREALARSRKLLEALPPIPAAGFERRLDLERAGADLSVCASVFNGGRALLSGSVALRAWARQTAAWQDVRRLVAAWDDPDHRLHDAVTHLWMEFETSESFSGQSAVVAPDVHLTFRDVAVPRSSAERIELAREAIEIMTPEASRGALAERMAEVLCGTTPCSRLGHIGFPLSRDVGWVRLVLDAARPSDVIELLDRSGLDAKRGPFLDLPRALTDVSDRIKIDLDVGETTVSPRIGVEYHMDRRVSVRERWDQFFEHAVRHGLCLSEITGDLVGWIGSTQSGDSVRWPAPVAAAQALLGPRVEPVLFRVLSHVKVAVGADRPPEAKVYFGYFYRLVERHGR